MLLDREADMFLAKRSDADGWIVKPLDSFRLRRADPGVARRRLLHRAGIGRDRSPRSPSPTTDPEIARLLRRPPVRMRGWARPAIGSPTYFPVFALEVRTPRLTLRFPDDDDLVCLAELGARGVHSPDTMPFTVPWTRVPSPYQERNTLQFMWQQRLTLQGDVPSLTLVTVVEGEIVGTQGLMTSSWKGTRTIETGSWLGLAHQGKGIGKEMRRAALHLVFDGFGAERAVTAAYADNPSSIGVTESLGYRPNGDELTGRDGGTVRLVRYVMDRDDFAALAPRRRRASSARPGPWACSAPRRCPAPTIRRSVADRLVAGRDVRIG